jgi:hypothetical protein
MEDEHYDETLWERYEDEGRWMGWQGRYSERYDPYFERLNRLNSQDEEGYNQNYGPALDFESYNRGPYARDVNKSDLERSRPGWRPDHGGRNFGPQFEGASNWRGQAWWQVPGPYAGRGPHGYHPSDETIWEEVCERLARHGRMDARNVEVQVENGVVTLKGRVHNRGMKRLAEALVDSVPSVQDINNRLRPDV